MAMQPVSSTRLAMRDVATACDLLRPVWEQTGGRDGYVSIEVDPTLAADTDGSIAQATHFHETIARPNLLVKIPATDAGVPAIEEMTARGYSINVTLIFSLNRHRQVAEAYLRGLERLIAAGGDPGRVHSVASFFVSRVDTETDRRLAARGRDDLRGQLAIANAKLAYQQYKELFSGARWQALAARDATKQRCLWASTSTKDPSYRDTLYVDELIGPETITTMPEETIAAFQDHGRVERRLETELERREAGVERVVLPRALTTTTSSPRLSAKVSRSSTAHSTSSWKASPTSASCAHRRESAQRKPKYLDRCQERGSSTASRVPAPLVDSMSSAPLTDATRSRIPTSPNPPSAPRALGETTPVVFDRENHGSLAAGEGDAHGFRLRMLDDVRQGLLGDPEDGGLELRGQSRTSRKIDLELDLRSASLLQTPLRSLRAGARPNSSSAGGRRANASRPTFSSALRAFCPQGCRRLTGLRERRRSIDRREAEEDRRQRGARLVVQLSCDPAPLGLLGFEDRVDRFARHAF